MSAHVGALWTLGQIEMDDGSLDRSREMLKGAIETARPMGDFEFEGACASMLSRLAEMANEPELARAAVQRALGFSEDVGGFWRVSAHAARGTLHLLDGDAERAAEAWEYALSMCGPGLRNVELYLQTALARAWLATGDAGRARARAEEILAVCFKVGGRIDAIGTSLVLSASLRADAGAGEAARIDEVLATTERLIVETGACNLTSFVLVERAALSELGGDEQQRLIYLRDALARFEQMGASGQVARLEQELGSCDGRAPLD